jgi:hypothetical protein
MSPAGCAAGLPSAARPAYGRAVAGAPRGMRILAVLVLAGAALLALTGCHVGYPHACDGHGGTRVVLKGIYYCHDGSTIGGGWLWLHPGDPRAAS